MVASLGDSVCLLIRKNGTFTKLSVEHNVRHPDELQRIKANGGSVLRGKIQGELSVSRAFGNAEHKKLIIATPEIRDHQLNETDDLLVISTDGLFRSFTQEHVVDRITALRKQGKPLYEVAD
jgi:serine/threonine protein phosphatase PrpC